MKTARFNISFDSENDAEIIKESINPEIKNKIPKTTVKLSISKNNLFLEINAKDLSSLRAATNSYLRWIDTALNVKQKI